MGDRSGRQVRGDAPGTDGASDSRRPGDSRWVSFYSRVYRSIRYANVFFGGLAAVGALGFVRFAAVLIAEPGAASLSSLPMALGGCTAFTVGIGYFVVRYNTSCPECDAEFSRKLIDRRLAPEQSDGQTCTIQRLECRNCGHETSYTCTTRDQESHRW